tara:strand:+ start:797 stop:1327 length:531 start_codon:yes stop_codon:yes gene_type:complete
MAVLVKHNATANVVFGPFVDATDGYTAETGLTLTPFISKKGNTAWASVVSDAACSESAGLVYYDEVFDSGTGYAEGDSIRVTFKSQKITVSANDYEISDATGRFFYTYIRETMRGTDSASTHGAGDIWTQTNRALSGNSSNDGTASIWNDATRTLTANSGTGDYHAIDQVWFRIFT